MTDKNKKSLHPLWGDFYSKYFKSTEESIVEMLGNIPMLQTLKKRELKIISKYAYERSFEIGELIFETGQPGAAMFIIKEGEIKIVRKIDSGDYVDLAILKNGEFFGELALLDNSPRSATALVSRPTTTIAIFREDLNNLLESHPELGGKIMKRLAIITGLRLKATNGQLLEKENEIQKLKDKLNERS